TCDGAAEMSQVRQREGATCAGAIRREDFPQELTRAGSMKPCEACKALTGMPSSTPPHGDLSDMGSPRAGAQHAERYDEYRCTGWGNRMLRNTPDGDPAGVWSLGASTV